ncbi:MAG: sugar phosphate nucleotidyltransferase [Candidatus Komeilibacteria bacterium]|nr:sugar phosphate nucleotidyltransferase [Candidatus Komeilibacteria bacterium]
MKGVILAGGTGSRLLPLTKVTNKHLLPVGRKPMIFHPIQKLIEAGVGEILIVTGIEHMGAVVALLGSGKDFGCRFTYKVQDEAGGIAQALGLAENFAGSDSVIVLLGDNVFQDSIVEFVKDYSVQGGGAKIILKGVKDPERFGVAELSGDKVVGIEEKPVTPKSNWAVTGVYLFDQEVFNVIRSLKPSERGELEITDVNNDYIQRGKMTCGKFVGWWTDAGTHESLSKADQLARETWPE